MYPETKFKVDRRATSAYQVQSSIYQNVDQYISSKTGGNTLSYELSYNNGSNIQERDFRNKSFEYHEKYNGNMISDTSNILNKTTSYGISTKKTFPQRKSLYNNQNYSSQITSPKSYNSNIQSMETQKTKASLSAYNLIPKSLLNEDNKKQNQSVKENKQTNAQNISTANKRNSLGQYPVTKAGHNKKNSVSFENRRRSQSHPTKSKSDNILQKPKLGVIGVLSAKKSLNEFSKRSSRVLNQQTEEINNLKARIQELTSDQEILRKLNEVSAEDKLLEFNDKYLSPLLSKMETYLMKFSSEYNEMIKANGEFLDSQHDRTECLVELAANLNSQLHNFIEDFECDKFDERTYNEKRSKVDVIADTTSRLNSQLARVVLQLDDYRDSPDFQKENMTNSIQSLSLILQQLNKAAITVNQKITEYESTIKQNDFKLNEIKNEKEMEIESLKNQIKELTEALEQKPLIEELEARNGELIIDNNKNEIPEFSSDILEKYKHDLVSLNQNLANVTLLFDSQIKQKNSIMKNQEEKISDLTQRYAKLNTQLSNITLLFDSEINIKNKIIKEKQSQIEKLRNTAAELNNNLSILTLLCNEKEISNKRNINNLMETISGLQSKWATINSNLLTLTSNVNDQLRNKNEEIRLNRKDAVYFRDFTNQLYKQMMEYVGDFLQRIWNKNHENELLIEKNKELIAYCSNLNSRVAKFTLEINDLQHEKKMLMSKLINGESISQQPITREVVREVIREIPVVREVPVSVAGSIVDDSKVEYYKNMAVDLNNRVAMLSLNIDSLKVNKYNESSSQDKTDFYRNQAVSLNSNLAKLTLEINDYKNQVLLKKNNEIKNSKEKIEFYQKMAANLNTRLAVLSLEMNDINKPMNDNEVTDGERYEYYQSLVLDLNSKISQLLFENESLKTKLQSINEVSQERSGSINENTIIFEDQNKVEHFRDLAVDLNSRLAKITLELNEKPKNIESMVGSNDYVQKLQNQIVDLNQRLAILTLNGNDEINNLKRELNKKEQTDFKNKVVDLNQRLAVLTLNSNEEINYLKKNLNQKDNGSFKNKVIDLNQRLSTLTLNSNDEINKLKQQLAQKNSEIDKYRNKLAVMNRQIIDLTFNTNLEKQNNTAFNNNNIQNRNIEINNNNNYNDIINEKDLIIRQLQSQLAEINAQNNNSILMAELENEKRKNQELKHAINNMRNEMNSITDYLKETVSVASSMESLPNAVNSSSASINEEIASIAEYIRETKQSLEDYKKLSNEEINSITNYLKDTIQMAEEYKSSN